MAVTKIHPIRRTVGQAIEYITNPKKTEDMLFVSTFGCELPTCLEEFAQTRNLAENGGTTLAQHIIQSFAADEVTPEEAHKIGLELANRYLEGKHEFILATHLDRGHLHNHIIFNHVDFVDHKCFRNNIGHTRQLREMSDEICMAHGLSVIKEKSGSKGKSYYEWKMAKAGKSYKQRLKNNIDLVIPRCSSYDEFISEMQALGYEVKFGKSDSFRYSSQERFSRSKILGNDYTKEAITARILSRKEKETAPSSVPFVKVKVFVYDQKLGLIENTSAFLSALENPYFARQVALSDAKKIAATYNMLKEKKIDSYDDLLQKLDDCRKDYNEIHDSVKELENEISEINEMIKFSERISTHKEVYSQYLKSKKSHKFREQHHSEIALYESAQEMLKKKVPEGSVVKIAALKKQLQALEDEKDEKNSRLQDLKSEQKDLQIMKKNVEIILDEGKEKDEEERKKRQNQRS